MLIDILHIPEEGKEFSYQEDPANIQLSPDIEFKGVIDVQAFLYKTEETIIARGRINATPSFQCGRCSKNFFLPLAIDFDQIFVPKNPPRPAYHKKQEEKKAPRSSLKKKADVSDLSQGKEELDNPDENYYEGSSVVLDEMIREQVLLEFPMRPLCSPTCKGVCPRCGIDWNVSDCSCLKDEDAPGSMEKIFKKILKEKKGE